jgi:hypothetical protein
MKTGTRSRFVAPSTTPPAHSQGFKATLHELLEHSDKLTELEQLRNSRFNEMTIRQRDDLEERITRSTLRVITCARTLSLIDQTARKGMGSSAYLVYRGAAAFKADTATRRA